MDRGAWQAIVHGGARVGHDIATTPPPRLICSWQTGKFLLHLICSSSWQTWFQVNNCQCREYKRCGFDPWVGKLPRKRKWQHTPVFLPGKSHGQRSQAGYSPLAHKRVGYDLVTKQQQHLPTPLRNYQGWTPGSGTPLSLQSLPTLTWLLLLWAMAKIALWKYCEKNCSDPGWL